MALGNWAMLAVKTDGTQINVENVEVAIGWPASPAGVTVEIYKDFVYVLDEASPKRPSALYEYPFIMSVNHGHFVYVDWHVHVVRGPREGVYVAAWFQGPKGVEGYAGCGVYGYDDGEWVGVTEESVAFLAALVSSKEIEFPPEMSRVFPEEIARLDFTNLRSVNAGEAFMERNFPHMGEPGFDPEKAR